MNSEDESLVNKLLSIHGEELMYKFNSCYPQLLEDFNTKNSKVKLQIVQIFHSYCQTSNFENCAVIQSVIEEFKDLFTKNISSIDTKLQSAVNVDELNQVICMLQIEIEILSSYSEFLKNIAAGQISFEEIKGVAVDIVSVLSISFKHIRNYAELYQDVNSNVIEKMNLLFKQSQETQECYFSFLDNLIEYNDTKTDDDLVVIFNHIFDIGVSVSNMDLKTMAHVWKKFLSFLKSVANEMKDKINILPIMEFIHEELIRRMTCLLEDCDLKRREVTLKIISFFLKIMLRICEYLSGSLEKSFHVILKPIYYFYELSVSPDKISRIFPNPVEEITRTLFPSLDELIGALMVDQSFAHYFLSSQDKNSDIGILLVLCTVLKKFISSTEEVQNIWLESSLWKYSLKIIFDNHQKLCCQVKLPTFCMNTTASSDVYLYDALMVNLASLVICTLTENQFSSLEQILITYLLKSSLLMQLFIIDFWCIIDRYGSSELCFQHVHYLLSVLHQISPTKNEAILLSTLIKRLFAFLSPSQQVKILEKTSVLDDDFVLFSEILGNSKVMSTSAVETLLKFKNCSRLSLGENTAILRIAFSIRDLHSVLNEKFTPWIQSFVVDRWKITGMIELFEQDNYYLVSEYLFYLCSITTSLIISLSPDEAVNILNALCLLSSCESCLILLNIHKVLGAFGNFTMNGSKESEICDFLSSSFRVCLQSKNPIIKNSSLESFSYFCHLTKCEKVISNTVSNDASLKEDVADYLRKKTRQTNTKQFETFLMQLFRYRKEKIVHENTLDDNSLPLPAMKRLKSNVLAKIIETETQVIYLLELMKINSLNETEKNSLRSLINVSRELENFL